MAEDGQVYDKPYITARRRSRRRRETLNLSVSPGIKLEAKKWANELFLDSTSDLFEYLVTRHREGTLFITESRDFFSGMARSIELRAEAIALETAEKTATRVLADHGIIESPYRK